MIKNFIRAIFFVYFLAAHANIVKNDDYQLDDQPDVEPADFSDAKLEEGQYEKQQSDRGREKRDSGSSKR